MTNDGKFQGTVYSSLCTGPALISLSEEVLVFEDAGWYHAIPFSGIDAFYVQNYKLIVVAGQERVEIAQMGRDTDVLYAKLWDSYNARTLKAFFVSGQPMFETQGEYAYSDDGGAAQGIAKISLFDNCLCLLPPCSDARRIPLCFMSKPVIERFMITMTLDTGETYQVMRLGSHTQRLFELICDNIQRIRENAVAAVKRLDGTLSESGAAQLARLMPDGAAAQLDRLYGIAPSFVSACQREISNSRAADTFMYFREICGPDELYAGIKTDLSRTDAEAAIWVVAIKTAKGIGTAAVELALSEESAAATYLYRFSGDKDAFFMKLNHAMEAISFHREVISLPERELSHKDNDLYAMAVKRTGSLRFLRKCFNGRAIHRTPESWQSTISEKLSGA
ncbi:MAG: hypothetical protein GX111_00005 [Clostridiales bacterium]|nr:hypothetical protein [Clostridiales bacterium]